MSWPMISIVTPSFNSREYILETIHSVINQFYPNIEYLIMDGGSTDGTVDLLRSFGGEIKWVSERDEGQSNAINKGFKIVDGEIVSWINSNDLYLPGAFKIVGRYFMEHPEVDFVFGKLILISESGESLGDYGSTGSTEELLDANHVPRGHFEKLLNHQPGWIPQPTAFWRTSLMKKAGLLDVDLHYAMDYEYWLRLGQIGNIHFINAYLGAFRIHGDAKTATNARKHWQEVMKVNRKYRGAFFSAVHKRFVNVCAEAIQRRVVKIGKILFKDHRV